MWERKTFERFRDRAAVLFFFPVSDEHLVTRSPLSGLAPIDFTAGVACSAPAPPLIKQSIGPRGNLISEQRQRLRQA